MRKNIKLLSFVIAVSIILSALFILVGCGKTVKWSDWEVIKQPTCTEDGEMARYQLKDSSKIETEIIPAEGHSYGDWEVINEPTHESEGEKRRVCGICDDVDIQPIEILVSPYYIDVYEGTDRLERIYIEDDGKYKITPPAKAGYECVNLTDAEGNEFPLEGELKDKISLYVEWSILPTRTFDELSERAAAGVDKIFIDGDIEMTDTVYFVGQTEIYVEKSCVIKRGDDFLGDMFVIGENKDGQSALLLDGGMPASLTIKPQFGTTLSFDGNRDGVKGEVCGTCFFVVYSSTFNMYDGVDVRGFHKTANSRVESKTENGENKYKISYPHKIGGAAMIVVNGTFNMYGGDFVENTVNIDEAYTGDDAENDDALVSSCGGAIYNYNDINIYGGGFYRNEASRGGAIYNYRTVRVFSGEFTQNSASVYAGAIYLSGSQYCALYLGNPDEQNGEIKSIEDAKILFDGNIAEKSGGAVFGQMKNSITVYSDTAFSNNTAKAFNGGAINTSGALIVKDGYFANNTAASKGGAIYAYYSNPELTTRQVDIGGGVYSHNQASKGGAIAFSASDTDFPKGSIGFIGNAVFSNNKAYATFTEDPELPDAETDNEGNNAFNGNGGAIYVSRKSSLSISGGAVFSSNEAERNGGAIYITGGSELMIPMQENSTVEFCGNTAGINGGGIYVHGENTVMAAGGYVAQPTELDNESADNQDEPQERIFTVRFMINSCGGKGGALYVTNGSVAEGTTVADPVQVKVENMKFEGNTSNGNGGAIYCYTASEVTVENSYFEHNKATHAPQGGGAVYLTGAKVDIIGCEFKLNVASNKTEGAAEGGNGGAIGVYNEKSVLNAVNSKFEENRTEDFSKYGSGAIHISAATVKIDGCTFCNNSTIGNGGAVGAYSKAKVTVVGKSVFERNNADGNGGALYIASDGGTSVTVDGEAVFAVNHATIGGAVYVTGSGSVLNVKGTEFAQNSAATNGGAIYVTGPATVTLEDVTATSNAAAQGGFLYYTKTGTVVSLISGSASGNTATKGGSAIWSNTTAAKLHVVGTETDTVFKVDGENVVKNGTSITGNSSKITIEYINE